MNTTRERYAANYERMAQDDLTHEIIPEYYRLAQVRKLKSYCGNLTGKRVLDIGAGRGEFLSLIPEALERVAVDIAPSFVQHLQAQNFETYCADAESLSFEGRFDLVVMTDILEHVLHPGKAVDSAWRALRAGGRVVVRVPYKEDISVYQQSRGCKYEFAHLRSFDEQSLRLFLHPFKVRHTYYDGFMAYRRRGFLSLFYRLDNELSSYVTGGKVKGPHLFVSHVICSLPNAIASVFFRPLEICMVGEKVA